MNSSLIPFLEVDVKSVTEHHWNSGQSLLNYPAFHYNLWLLLDGSVTVAAGGTTWHVQARQMFMMPVHLIRDITSLECAHWLSIGLRATVFNRTDFLSGLDLPRQWTPTAQENRDIEIWMHQLLRERENLTAGNALLRTGLGRAVLGACWPYLISETTPSQSAMGVPDWLSTAIHYIQEHPSVSISELAHAVGVSPAHFRRAFHTWLGIPPRDYLRSQRLGAARHMLESTHLPVRSIALAVGFSSLAHFSTLFTRAYGLAPGRYRISSQQTQL